MKNWIKYLLIFIGLTLIVSSIWFDWFFWQGNNKTFEDSLAKATQTSDVIIIFNSGGYGTVRPEKAWDFEPIINGIKQTVESMGYTASVVPYYRTEDSLLGKAAYFKEVLFGFPKESEYLAVELQKFSENNSQKKIVMAGLSNGAAFVGATMDKIKCCQTNIIAVEFGPPFWMQKKNTDNILCLTNNGKDTFASGNIPALIWSTFKAPVLMVYTKVIGKPISFPEAMAVPGHQYNWPQVAPQVSSFVSQSFVKVN